MTSEWSQLLYQALAEPIGLGLWASDPQRAVQRLYQARAKLADPQLAVLQFRQVAWEDEGEGEINLVICKRRLQLSKQESEPC